MPRSNEVPLEPRKLPVQARSKETVAVLFEASIQVLLSEGYRGFTTTRVADRAGVGVGTLYQYFPNRQALIAAVTQQYLESLCDSIEESCRSLDDSSLENMACGFVDAIFEAKCRRLDLTRAMQEPLADVDGVRLVKATSIRAAGAVGRALATCSDAKFEDIPRVAAVIVTVSRSLLQTAIADEVSAGELKQLHRQMHTILLGYLKEASHPGQRFEDRVRRSV